MRVLVRVLIVSWVAASLAATQDRARLWALGERALWADTVGQYPEKPRPWVNLGRQYALDGDDALAADAYERALAASVQSERSMDEQIFGRGLAAANLAILRCTADHDVEAALATVTPIMAATIDPNRTQLIPTDVRKVYVWLQQRKATDGCGAPALSF